MSIEWDPTLAIIGRGALALLFVVAGTHKLRDLSGFRAAVRRYDIIPSAWGGQAAFGLAALELIVGAGLVLPVIGRFFALGAGCILALYTLAVSIALYRGRRIDCGCGGPAGRLTVSNGLVARNVMLVLVAVLCMLPAGNRVLTWLDGVTVAAGISALALLYVAADTALANAGWQGRAGDDSKRLSWSTR